MWRRDNAKRSKGVLTSIRKLGVGDFVHQDEEVATIETDKIDVTVNSPASGTIIEVYANEEDNVSVGADFFKLELGDAPKEGSWEFNYQFGKSDSEID